MTDAEDRGYVLVLDPDQASSCFIAETLVRAGLEVVVAHEGREGYWDALRLRPDVVVVAAATPGPNSASLVQALRGRDELAAIPIVGISTAADGAVRGQLLRDGAQDCLTEPLHAEELCARVCNLLGRKRAEERLERLRHQLEDVVAHDLQQPINAIVLRTDLLLRSPLGEPERAQIGKIRASTMRLADMVSELTDVSLLESHRIHLIRQRLDLGQLIRDVVERASDPSRVVLHTPEHPLYLDADPVRLDQVFLNLLSNAAKYGERGAPIVVTVEATASGGATVAVANRGPEIPPDELPSLFDRFFRTRAARSSGVYGAGLGLYIAKGMVQAHGGEISVHSAHGETRFLVELPIAPELALPARSLS
ncbi:MAG: hybrid sensor histidine kinase/response regulator [Kofleriaceae bacterium]